MKTANVYVRSSLNFISYRVSFSPLVKTVIIVLELIGVEVVREEDKRGVGGEKMMVRLQ